MKKNMNVYDLKECVEERDQVKKENRETIPYLIEFTKEFNKDYGDILNKFFRTDNKNFNMIVIYYYCDVFLSFYID